MTLEELLGLGLAARAIAEELGRAYLAVEQSREALLRAEKAKAEAEARAAGTSPAPETPPP